MPKKLADDLTGRIEAEIGKHTEGLTAAQIAQQFQAAASLRTMGRRLKHLAKLGRITVQGKGRASRYAPARIAPVAGLTESPDATQASAEVYVRLSRGGEQIRNLVRRPIQERTPVSYNRDFLDRYQPNETSYLLPEERDRLYELGRTRFAERPAGTYARDIMNRLLIDLSWASSRLEGNTYTRLDTENLIQFGRAAEGKAVHETQMILNHKQAIEFLIENADEIGFNTFTFFNLHALLSENLLKDASARGRIRTRIIEVSGTTYYPLAAPQQLDELFRVILERAGAISDPFEQAFFILVQIPYLQPFEDFNKRVSRLGANIPFLKKNLCPLSFVDVPQRAYFEGTLAVYELSRIELLRDVFIWAYERSCQRYAAVVESLPEPDPFRLRYRNVLREIVATVIREQLPLHIDEVAKLSVGMVPEGDRDQFIRMAMQDLEHLHEGNIALYRIRLAEFNAWRQRWGKAAG